MTRPATTLLVTVPTVVIGLFVPILRFTSPELSGGLARLIGVAVMVPGALVLGLSLGPFVLAPPRDTRRRLVMLGAVLWVVGLGLTFVN